jgi:hypothetical protein
MLLAGVIGREFPDFEIESSFPAALTVYHVQMKARVLEYHNLSIIARFMLRAISLPVRTAGEVAYLLGLDEVDLVDAGAELLMASLIEQTEPDSEGRRGLHLTEKGRQMLLDERMLARPRQRTLHLHFEPLTRKVRDRDKRAISIEQIRKDGVYVIPSRAGPPTGGEIPVAAVKAALDASTDGPLQFEIVSLRRPDRMSVEYIPGVQIYILRHKQSGDRRIAAFSGLMYEAAISEVVQEWYEEGEWGIPAEALYEPPPALDTLLGLPSPIAETAAQIAETDREIEDLRTDIATQQHALSQTASSEERRAMEERIRALEEQVLRLDRERADLRAELEKGADGEVDVLTTEEHRPLLVDALQSAREEVIIVSPWMNLRTVDGPLRDLIGRATARGVRVCIGYGFGSDRQGAESDRNRTNARAVIDNLQRAVGQVHRELLIFHDFKNTHEKILVCDRKYAVVTSFNWLSYRGDIDEEFRRETGQLVRSQRAIERVLARIGKAFGPIIATATAGQADDQ